jgi:hypothetical protein
MHSLRERWRRTSFHHYFVELEPIDRATALILLALATATIVAFANERGRRAPVRRPRRNGHWPLRRRSRELAVRPAEALQLPADHDRPALADRDAIGRGEKKSHARHYGSMPFKAIQALPVGQLAAPDCIVFLWCTWPLLLYGGDAKRHFTNADASLLAGRRVPAKWGFRFVTGGAWHKRTKHGHRVRARIPRAQRVRAVPARRQRHAEQLEVAPQPDRGLGAPTRSSRKRPTPGARATLPAHAGSSCSRGRRGRDGTPGAFRPASSTRPSRSGRGHDAHQRPAEHAEHAGGGRGGA